MKKQIYFGDLKVQINFGAKRGRKLLPPEYLIARKAVWRGEDMEYLNQDEHTVGQMARILKIKDKSKIKIVSIDKIRERVGFTLR